MNEKKLIVSSLQVALGGRLVYSCSENEGEHGFAIFGIVWELFPVPLVLLYGPQCHLDDGDDKEDIATNDLGVDAES